MYDYSKIPYAADMHQAIAYKQKPDSFRNFDFEIYMTSFSLTMASAIGPSIRKRRFNAVLTSPLKRDLPWTLLKMNPNLRLHTS